MVVTGLACFVLPFRYILRKEVPEADDDMGACDDDDGRSPARTCEATVAAPFAHASSNSSNNNAGSLSNVVSINSNDSSTSTVNSISNNDSSSSSVGDVPQPVVATSDPDALPMDEDVAEGDERVV